MKIAVIRDGGSLTLAPEGRLDTATSPELEIELTKNLSAAEKLIFDFEKLEYLTSAGLRVLLFAQRAMKDKGEILIRRPNRLVMEVFHVTGFDQVLNIEE